MALGATLRRSDASSANASSYAFAAFTPGSNCLLVAHCLAIQADAEPTTPTLSGGSLTWTSIDSHYFITSGTNRYKHFIFAARVDASPGSMQVTMDFGGVAQIGAAYDVVEYTGSDYLNGVAQCFVQKVKSTADPAGNTTMSLTLAAASNSSNRPALFVTHLFAEGTLPRANWTELGDSSESTPAQGNETQWRSDTFETTASASWNNTASYGGIAYEIKNEVVITINPKFLSILGVQSKSGYDTNAQAFFTAASITDTTQMNAINQLVLDLKHFNLWARMKALYPMVGGSATSHAVNLITPGTYDLTFAGSWTHASTGAKPDSVSSANRADTGLNASTVLASNTSFHMSFYSRTSLSVTGACMGSGGGGLFLDMYPKYTNGNAIIEHPSAGAAGAATDSLGLITGSRTASDAISIYRNATSLNDSTTATGNYPNVSIYLGGRHDVGSANCVVPSVYECALASIGDGFTATDVLNYNIAVQAYQTALSRNV